MNKFQFNPPNGLLDTNIYPTNPSTEAEARGQVQDPLNQIKNYLHLFLDDFVFNKNTNGYTKLPNGLIIQWGVTSTGTGLNSGFTSIQQKVFFPINFPTNVFGMFCNVSNNTTTNNSDYLGSMQLNARVDDTTSATVEFKIVDSISTGSYIFEGKWIAIGY